MTLKSFSFELRSDIRLYVITILTIKYNVMKSTVPTILQKSNFLNYIILYLKKTNQIIGTKTKVCFISVISSKVDLKLNIILDFKRIRI